ncbi:MAG: hypothetical protein ABI697_04645, partial [Devosia sp.]
RRAEMSAAGSAGSHIPDGTPPAPTPLPPVEPMAIPPEQEGPPTPRSPTDEELARTQQTESLPAPNKTQPIEDAPQRPTGEETPAGPTKPAPLDLAGAQKDYDAALDAFRNDPSAANKAALTEALHGLDRAEAANPRPQTPPPVAPSAELSRAQQAYDEALTAYRQDRSPDNAAALDKALGDYNRAVSQSKTGSPEPVQSEGPPTPRPQAEPEPASPKQTQPMEGAPQRSGPEAIRAARDEFTAAQQRAAEAEAAVAKNPTPEAIANRDKAQQASADAARAERDAWAAATPEQRAEAYKPFEDTRIAAQQASDDAERAYDLEKSPEKLEAYRQADAALVEARRAELAAQLRSGIDKRGSNGAAAPPVPAEPATPAPEQEGPPTPRPQEEPQGAALAASPNAQSVVINKAPPLEQPAGPQEVKPIAPLNKTQPMDDAPALPPQTPAQRADAIRAYTDAAVVAHNSEVAAANAVLANDTPATRAAYDKAVTAADRARVAEAGQWYKVGGAGFPPSRAPGTLEPLPTGLRERLGAGGDAVVPAADANLAGGTNSTLAIGLGSLAGTIAQGP